MWRLNNIGQLIEPLALRIHEFWNGFPRNKKLGMTSRNFFCHIMIKSLHTHVLSLKQYLKSWKDAAYERTYDGSIVFFSGAKVYRFQGTQLMPNYPKNLSEEFIVPKHSKIPKRIDAGKWLIFEFGCKFWFQAIHWDQDRLTYLFFGSYFWKIDEYKPDKLSVVWVWFSQIIRKLYQQP